MRSPECRGQVLNRQGTRKAAGPRAATEEPRRLKPWHALIATQADLSVLLGVHNDCRASSQSCRVRCCRSAVLPVVKAKTADPNSRP
jgi:hypothetical protein